MSVDGGPAGSLFDVERARCEACEAGEALTKTVDRSQDGAAEGDERARIAASEAGEAGTKPEAARRCAEDGLELPRGVFFHVFGRQSDGGAHCDAQSAPQWRQAVPPSGSSCLTRTLRARFSAARKAAGQCG